MKLTPADFTMFPQITPYLAEKIRSFEFEHRPLTREEHDAAIRDMVMAIHEKELSVAGAHRQKDWETGWGENLSDVSMPSNLSAQTLVKPKYYNKYPVVRWKGDLFVPKSPDYEQNMLAVIEHYVFDKYFRHNEHFYEFGCGTGHNLLRLREANPTAFLHGLDWAQSAVDLINTLPKLSDGRAVPNIDAHRFDFFNPDWSYRLKPLQSCAYTVAALEQVGSNFHPWLQYIREQNPRYVVHIEPIAEVLTPDVLQDYLSIEYFKKRGYLSGYLTHLQLLADRREIYIHEITRTSIGSKFIEGYTIVVWSDARNNHRYYR